jgi:uncharacterized protein
MINYKYVILIIAVFIYALIIQYRYLAYFIPNKIIKYTPNDFSMEYNEINIDGLNGWLFVNPNINLDNPDRNLAIFYHGNAGNISNRIGIIKTLLSILPSIDIFIYDYPQFGISQGELIPSNVISGAYKVYNYWASEINSGTKSKSKSKYNSISMIGESIGAGVMSEVLKIIFKFKHNHIPKNLIHLNGITSLRDIVGNVVPYIVHPIILPWIEEFNPEKIYSENIKNLPNLIIIHTPKDEIVPIKFVKKLLHKLRLAKSIHFVKISGSHNNLIIDSNATKKIKLLFN